MDNLKIYPDGRMDAVNAAAYLGLAPKTLAQMRVRGDGPAFTKVLNRVFYRQQDLDAWLDGFGTFTSTGQAQSKRGGHA